MMPTKTIFNANDEDTTLGGRISNAREASGLSVAQVVKRLGVRKKTFEAWETDRSEPRANKLVALAGILNVSPPYLIGGLGGSPTEKSFSETDLFEISSQVNKVELKLKETNRALQKLKELLVKNN